jgi:hypothetical protein
VRGCLLYCFPSTNPAGTLGVDRATIKTFYKIPDRPNVFQQVRYTDKITVRWAN